jgi:hypothetical protein
MLRVATALVFAGLAVTVTCLTAGAQTVWSGYGFSFTRVDDANPTLPENQDRITENVWITRQVQQGIFNIHDETSYQADSPADTQWATYINNPTATIAATNYTNLTFAPWIDAYGGPAGGTLPGRLLGGNAVVHLVTDDIYLDLRFTDWTFGAQGGGFAYERALEPVVEPETTGDYNLDGIVDAADYVLWRKTFNQSVAPDGSGADGDGDGIIDDGDYDFWRTRFGEIVPGSGGAVPEPGTVALLAVALLVGSCRRLR